MNNSIHSFFVYGTLKQRRIRSGLWPCKPLHVTPATIQASLFDLGSYPGIRPGNDWILGELWQLKSEDVPITILTLDEVEGYDPNRSTNEYYRDIITCETFDDDANRWQSTHAYCYFVGSLSRVQAARPILPSRAHMGRMIAEWPDAHSRVPARIEDE